MIIHPDSKTESSNTGHTEFNVPSLDYSEDPSVENGRKIKKSYIKKTLITVLIILILLTVYLNTFYISDDERISFTRPTRPSPTLKLLLAEYDALSLPTPQNILFNDNGCYIGMGATKNAVTVYPGLSPYQMVI